MVRGILLAAWMLVVAIGGPSSAAELNYKNMGPDLPTEGSSLFDLIFSKKQDGKIVYDVPYPYDLMIRRLKGFDVQNFSESQLQVFAQRTSAQFKKSLEDSVKESISGSLSRSMANGTLGSIIKTGQQFTLSNPRGSIDLLSLVKDTNRSLGQLQGALLRCSLAAVKLPPAFRTVCADSKASTNFQKFSRNILAAFFDVNEAMIADLLESDPQQVTTLLSQIDLDIGVMFDIQALLTALEGNGTNLQKTAENLALKYSERLLSRIRRTQNVKDFSQLVTFDLDALRGPSVRDISVSVPFGRSLQRPQHPSQLPLRNPRELIAPDLEDIEPLLEIVGPIKGRIFCGHFEAKKTLECISYNEKMARFEYQLVEHYEPNKQPKVTYVKRALCISCHQNQTPIFSRDPWTETQDNFTLMAGILVANSPISSKLSANEKETIAQALNTRFQKEAAHRKDESDRLNSLDRGDEFPTMGSIPGRFDRSVLLSGVLYRTQLMWQHLCGSEQTGELCRKQVLKVFVVNSLFRQNGEFLKGKNNVQALVDQAAQKNPVLTKGLLRVSPSVFENRDVFNKAQIELPRGCLEDGSQCGTGLLDLSLKMLTNHNDLINKLLSPLNLIDDPKLQREELNDVTKNFAAELSRRLANVISNQDLLSIIAEIRFPKYDANKAVEWVKVKASQGPALTVEKQGKANVALLSLDKCQKEQNGSLVCAGKDDSLRLLLSDADVFPLMEGTFSSGQVLSCIDYLRGGNAGNYRCYPFSMARLFKAIDALSLPSEPIQRAKVLAEIHQNLETRYGAYYNYIDQLSGPPKMLFSGHDGDLSSTNAQETFYMPDAADKSDSLSFFSRNACVSCHGVGAGLTDSSAPQFLAVKTRQEMEANIALMAPKIITQLWISKKMPPEPLRQMVTPEDHESLKKYIKSICTKDPLCKANF